MKKAKVLSSVMLAGLIAFGSVTPVMAEQLALSTILLPTLQEMVPAAHRLTTTTNRKQDTILRRKLLAHFLRWPVLRM